MIGRQDLVGKVVSEEEAATGLGFSSVHEMRRWDTEMGRKVANLEEKLREAISDRDRFQWHGKKMMVVLEKVQAYFDKHNFNNVSDLSLAISVVTGKGVDWHHRLKDWFDQPKESELEILPTRITEDDEPGPPLDPNKFKDLSYLMD
jgi:hypothetical protein